MAKTTEMPSFGIRALRERRKDQKTKRFSNLVFDL
jgi:hypothetical protein